MAVTARWIRYAEALVVNGGELGVVIKALENGKWGPLPCWQFRLEFVNSCESSHFILWF